jgi:hypothetical protein
MVILLKIGNYLDSTLDIKLINYKGKEFKSIKEFRSWLLGQPLEYKDSHIELAGKRQCVDSPGLVDLRMDMIDAIIKETCIIEWEGEHFNSREELHRHLLKLPMQYRNCEASIGKEVIRKDLSTTRMSIIDKIMSKYVK